MDVKEAHFFLYVIEIVKTIYKGHFIKCVLQLLYWNVISVRPIFCYIFWLVETLLMGW